MPKKYQIEVKAAPSRFSSVPMHVSYELKRCLGCRRCVKPTACVYGVHQKRGYDPAELTETGDLMCVGCFRCVQECKANIMSRGLNPRFARLGDDYWTPEIIAKIWKQAETGKIPVSGAGYRGPFVGPGFDRVWTDMSEIVRPTRDGIHGREYINTMVELGRRPGRLEFDAGGGIVSAKPRFREIGLPVVIDRPDHGRLGTSARRAMAEAAGRLRTLAVAEAGEATGALADRQRDLIVQVDPGRDNLAVFEDVSVAEIAWTDAIEAMIAKVHAAWPDVIVSVRLPLDGRAAQRAAALAAGGADALHLAAGANGRGMGDRSGVFTIDLVAEVHRRLVKDNVRDLVTLVASGGVALAEHVAKLILCGADAVGVDLAVLAALECRLCRDCGEQAVCPVELDRVPETWAAQRIVNLMGSWHSQLIEVMGAMGIREARRMRGEVGRAMFFEDLERESFAPIFGERSEAAPLAVNLDRGVERAEELEAPHPAPWRFTGRELQIERCPSRYRNPLTKYRVTIDNRCDRCGKCVAACRHGALSTHGGQLFSPKTELCRGPEACRAQGPCCVDACPLAALTVTISPLWETLGDHRWTADLIVSTWHQAEYGEPPRELGLEYRVGASGGGFDRMSFRFPETLPDPELRPQDVDLTIPLNRRRDDHRPALTIPFPVYGGGMSFGSISLPTMVGRARAYQAFGSFTCTGEGGYPDVLSFYADHVITQVATGLFGVREETIQRAPIVEFKYAQGAKPGLGGHLLGDKVTPAVAKMREAVVGSSLFSPFPFHSVYSVEDHKKHIDWVKMINPRALVSVKVSTPTDVDMVAVGSYHAGTHIIHLDGSYGGTGAAPDIAKKNIAMPIEYAIPKVHNFLVAEGVRDQLTLIVSGGIRTAYDIAKAIALGADGVVIGTAEMVALECVRCANCESGRGCPRGIATTDPELSQAFDVDWASRRLINLFHSFAIQLQEILWRLGLASVRELVGRSDLLDHQDYRRARERPRPSEYRLETIEARG